MIILIILFSAILILIAWMIFTPVNISINTDRGLYEISQPVTMRITFHPGQIPFTKVRVFGFSIDTYKEGNKEITKKKAKKGSSVNKSLSAWINLLRGILRSFDCRRFICSIDFDDVVLNAELFPIAYFASRGPVVLNINFEKQYHLDVWIQGRIYRIFWAFIRFFLTK